MIHENYRVYPNEHGIREKYIACKRSDGLINYRSHTEGESHAWAKTKANLPYAFKLQMDAGTSNVGFLVDESDIDAMSEKMYKSLSKIAMSMLNYIPEDE